MTKQDNAISIPNPNDYRISPKYGFLSPNPPLHQFDDSYYALWDALAFNLPFLIVSNTLSTEIRNLPLLEPDKDGTWTDLEYQRAYVILAFTVHGHVWHSDPPNEIVPAQLAEPFLKVCEWLGMQPVVSFAGLCTWNWQIRDSSIGMEVGNLDMITSFTGKRGEAAFYHVPVLAEWHTGHLIHLLLDAIRAAERSQRENVISALQESANAIGKMSQLLPKLYELLDAKWFYHVLRPFITGGKGLPRGFVFQKSSGEEVEEKLAGGSVVQSAFYPFLDIVLGVRHKGHQAVFEESRTYMPATQRNFLDAVARIPSLRDYMSTTFSSDSTEDVEVRKAFDACLSSLRSFRGKHIAVVSKYIVQPAREEARAAKLAKIEGDGISNGVEDEEDWEIQGTGGGALIPFLRDAKDDTIGVVGK